MFVYFIPLTVNLTKNSKLEKFGHELNAFLKLSGSSLGALRELVAVAGIHGRKPSLFFDIRLITFGNTTNPKRNTKTPKCARGKNIFDMRYIFVLIHHGLHFTCSVIYMEMMKIKYYNSLHFENVTRHGCKHKIKMQEDTLQVLRDYLQKEHMKEKHKDLPNKWKLYTLCNVPQQDKTITTYCGVLACMYCNFILNNCKLDFKQDDITNSDWRDRMILSILLVKPTNYQKENQL
jgi:Ulp1 family protease